MEIIAVPSNGKGGLNEDMSLRFGRCSSFTFVSIDNDEISVVKTVMNHANQAMGGAGVQASQIVGTNNANVVIVGNLGPNAVQSLNSLNLKIVQVPNQLLTVKQAVDLYIEGKLQEITSSNVGSHFGMGGQGIAGGRAMGGGMGGGRGRGRQF